MMQSKDRLFRTYGQKDSFAVVTGGSDGIGLSMCKQLANEGFNICIIARNEEKMSQKLLEIKDSIKNQDLKDKFKGMYIKCDFSIVTRIEEYEQMVVDKLKEIDIGVLVLNAGSTQVGPFNNIKNQDVERIVNVNALQVIYLAKTLLPQMHQRFQKSNTKSAIVVTSSQLGSIPVSGSLAYSASKSFASFVAEALNYECRGRIDVMSYQAGYVATKLINKFKTDLITIDPDTAAKTCLRDLGYQPITYGAARSHLTILALTSFPLRLIQKTTFAMNLKFWKKCQDSNYQPPDQFKRNE